MWALVARRPDVGMTMCEVLALPAERALVAGQRLHDQVDRLPEALHDADRIRVAGRHLAVARLHEADFEPAARNHIGHGIFLGYPYRIPPHGDQRALAENAHLARLPGDDPQD